nr:PREDICTED: RUN and FYVE domain-containing protein 4 [Apteryx mantelli mantelli]
MGQGVPARVPTQGSLRALPAAPPLSHCCYGAAHRPDALPGAGGPCREAGGCGDAKAPARHHFLLSLWCRAEAWAGGGRGPQAGRPPRAATGTKGEAAGRSVGAGTSRDPTGTQQAAQSAPRLAGHRPLEQEPWQGMGSPTASSRTCRTIAELNRSYREQNLPVTDGSRELHSLCAQLEFLLQFDLKEKRNFFGQRKDYWDFLCQGLARRRQEHEGVRFVTSLDKVGTPVGRARAFLRYCLVHRQLAESLQLCLLDPQSLSEWYYARSPFLSPRRRAEILGSLYELDGITFHLALRRADLDTAWARLEEQLGRARQDGERWASALQRAQREAMEREATRGEEQARQQELVRDMKGRLLELLREKDALWQKTEGIDLQMPSTAPRDVGLCARCHKDFRLLSRRYSCRLCHGKVCHTCSVDVGKQGRCCLLCYQQRHQQAT